ncbi:alpha/beta fold hydrolase [Actinopolyspora mortivallis]|uniref:Alpha/beta hydrolase n=1 Tax=Actinopolyspora mortivallis TaxID=33906 RepID=A0A2T0GZS3_ACTMO|nr:alpha/beta fold hydrolase [Actinopolyspora mortivallis]PRW64604.1 alpha/beta hydrolase [Actinopolyspora mortivallis]
MHYVESGAGPPLVLLHAFPVDERMWRDARAELEGRFRVVTPDQRGLGRSTLDGSPSAGPENQRRAGVEETDTPSLDSAAEDVLALLDHLELSRVHLGGCSMGGYVAMSVLRRAPERVAGLVLADTRPDADGEEQRRNRLSVAERAEREGVRGWLAENSLPGLLGRTTWEQRPEVVRTARTLVEEQPPEGVAWAQRAMAARPDGSEVLRTYEGPALVLRGEEDTLSSAEVARDMAALMPHARSVTLPEAGHLAPLENPSAFAAAVGDWLAELT